MGNRPGTDDYPGSQYYDSQGTQESSTGFNHLMFPKWFVGLILGTTNPLTIDIGAENQRVYSFRCQS